MLKLKLQNLGHLIRRTDSLEKTGVSALEALAAGLASWPHSAQEWGPQRALPGLLLQSSVLIKKKTLTDIKIPSLPPKLNKLSCVPAAL